MVWVWLPRFDRRRVVLALALLGPPVLLGAVANTLMAVHLAALELDATTLSGLADVRSDFKGAVELVNISLFVMFGLATIAALHMTEDAMKGLHGFGLATLVFLAAAVYFRFDFNAGVAEARLGMGIALWGIGWVLIMLHLFALLRSTPHRKWTYVTGAVGLVQAASFFLTLQLGIYADLEFAVLAMTALGIVSGVIVVANREEIADLWGYGLREHARLPDVDRRRIVLVGLYAVIVFALIGAEYVHHFAYVPVFGLGHYVLLAATTPVGVVLFGALSERGGRRALLYGVPLTVGIALVLQNLGFRWPVILAEGLILGSLPFLFQYLAEATKVLTRGSVFLFSMGAVAVLGLGGSFIAQFRAWTDLTADRLLVIEFGAIFLALLLAPQLPETRPQVSQEEELEDYLELARRLQAGD